MGQALSSCLAPQARDSDPGSKQQQQHSKEKTTAAAVVEAPPASSRTNSSSSSSANSGAERQQQQPPVAAPKCCAAAKKQPVATSPTPAAAVPTDADGATVDAAPAAAAVESRAPPLSAPVPAPAAATAAAAAATAVAAAPVVVGPHAAALALQESGSSSSSKSSARSQQQQQQQTAAWVNDPCSGLCYSMPTLDQQQQQQQQQQPVTGAGDAAGGAVPPPAGCAAGPGLPHNPYLSGPPLPPCDEDRLQDEALVAELLGTGPRKELDNILKLVCNIFGVENALIALFGERKIWVLNKISMAGIQEGDFEWRHSFCGWTMASEQHQVMVVNDALQDARFANNAMVVQGGIRFYAGSPLVNSSGHRLGTLCFADTKPRVFDTSSLQVLINLSELVAREMEREVVLAKQQYELQQREQQQAVAAAAAVLPMDGVTQGELVRRALVERYQLLLRSIDCITSAVLLVDTASPMWSILHSSTGWQQLLQDVGAQPTPSSTEAAAAAAGTAAGTAASAPGSGGSRVVDSSGSSNSSSVGLGQSLWSLLDAASLRSKTPGGVTAKQQVLQQVMCSQSFTLRGVRLADHLGGATVQLVFRCAGFSTVQGAISICLPSFAPDRSEVAAAAAALSRSNPTGTRIRPSSTPCYSLYFVTVKPSHNNSSGSNQGPSISSADAVGSAAAVAGSSSSRDSTAQLQQQQRGPPGLSLVPGSSRDASSNQLPYCFAGGITSDVNSGLLPGLGSIGPSSGSNGGNGSGCGSSNGGSNGAGGYGSNSPSLPVIDVVAHPQFSAADGAAERGDNGFVTDGDVFLSDMVPAAAAAPVPPPRHSPVAPLDSSARVIGVGRYHTFDTVPGSHLSSTDSSAAALLTGTVAAAVAAMVAGGSCCGASIAASSSSASTAAVTPVGTPAHHHQHHHQQQQQQVGGLQGHPAATVGVAGGSSCSNSLAAAMGPTAASGVARGRAAGQASGWRLTVERSSGSGSNSAFVGGGGRAASLLAGLVCERIAGLYLGGQIAAGSYGRVYKGTYFGSKVAVKVLDGADVLRRDAATGLSLEALLASGLRHPSIVATLAWAVVAGKGQLPARVQVWGQTLDPSKPSIAQNRVAITAAAGKQQQRQQQQQRHHHHQQQQQQDLSPSSAEQLPTVDTGSGGTGNSSGSSSGGGPAAAAAAATAADALSAAGATVGQAGDESSEDEEEEVDSSDGADLAAQVLTGQTWLIMEYCDRGCLQDACDRGWLRHKRSFVDGSINLAAVLATACEIASGMALLHSQGVVHGDLSAFNVMLSSNDPAASAGGRGFVARIADFGLARTLNSNSSKVVTKTYGTITHMPPEVLEHGVCSKAADVWSFGVLLWQMVTSSRAWAGMSHSAVVQAVCVQRHTLRFPPDAPEALTMLGQACLSYDPGDRPTFGDILEVLEPCQALLAA